MSNYIEVVVIVEGKTEQIFIDSILAPYLGSKNIGMRATQVSKPGQKGGDVRFVRVKKDIKNHLKQRPDTYVSTFVDYYGIKEWPGLDKVTPQTAPAQIAKALNEAAIDKVADFLPEVQTERRFIPFIAVHEFEALLFSDAETLADLLSIDISKVNDVLDEFGQPEAINNNPHTAPSKRLDLWTKHGKFPKTTMGITIAHRIGIEKMRKKCSLFDAWLQTFEKIQRASVPSTLK